MKNTIKSIAFGFIASIAFSCTPMNISPKNIVTDDDLLSNEAGMSIYLARLYSQMPWEDFKYMARWGINYNPWLGCLGVEGTGEALTRDWVCTSFTGEDTAYWGRAFDLIHEANHLIETLPDYKSNFANLTYNEFIGQGYFIRAYAFYQMARRFGGIPLVTKQIQYPSNEEIELPRSSEKETWDQILADFDTASELLAETATFNGSVDKYAALAFKAEAMLYAGSVAKYNESVQGRLTGLGEKTKIRVIGFASEEWKSASEKYFSEAYKAARKIMTSGKYSLYMKSWKEGDLEAQYKNMVDMWKDMTSPENILVRTYSYPTLSHGLDAYSSPFIFRAPLSAGTCPTLDFLELFEGFDTYADGRIRVTDGEDHTKGNYLLFDKPMDFFSKAEPRLRAYVIFPGDMFRGREIEIRSGIYTGNSPIKPLKSSYAYSSANQGYHTLPAYTETPKTLYMSSNAGSNQEYVEISGKKIPASGENGPFYSNGEATITGLYLRKYLDPDKRLADIGEGKSDQPFILMRYADVLLAAAESAVELALAGQPSPISGENMLEIATEAINLIRKRAGAQVLSTNLSGDNESRDIVRKERRKELAFEHKSKWDIRRWRVIDEENRNGFWGMQKDASSFSDGVNFRFMGLFPFYSTKEKKWFFDKSYQQIAMKTFRYSPIDYYFAIPGGEVAKSKFIDQQPNR